MLASYTRSAVLSTASAASDSFRSQCSLHIQRAAIHLRAMATCCHPVAGPSTPTRRLLPNNGRSLPAMGRRATVLPSWRSSASSGAHSRESVQPWRSSAVASQPLEVSLPPPVATQERELSMLLARLGQTASYGEKVGCSGGRHAGSFPLQGAPCRWMPVVGGVVLMPMHPTSQLEILRSLPAVEAFLSGSR